MKHFQLTGHPWWTLLVVILAEIIGQALAGIVVIGLLKRPRDAPVTQFVVATLGHVLVVFCLFPLVFRLPDGTRSYRAYLDAIRLSRVQPLLRLLILGLSCYLILALCQASGVLVYRVFQGQALTGTFIRGVFDLSGDLPPRSWSWLVSLPSALEEVAFRGVVLSVFMSKYSERRSILFAALGFGLIHLFNLASGREPVWVLGQVLWSALLGLFYGFLVVQSDSLLPAMLVHYLGNLFVGSLTSYLQASASMQTQAVYGIVFTFGLLPTTLMSLWVVWFKKLWPVVR